MEALVTGGAGFIGSHLVEELLEKGNNVTVIDNLSRGREERIPDEAELIKGDLKDEEFVLNNVNDFDVVFHLAANPDVAKGAKDRQVHIDENVRTTHNLLEVMDKNQIKDLVFTSTSTVYGEVEGSVSEDHGPLKPISLYGASKLSCEALISAYSEFGIKSWIFRLANIIGERSDHGVIPDFIKKLNESSNRLEVLGNGEQEKSYLYVEDCVDAMLHLYKNSNGKVNIFNIGSEDTIKVKDIAKIIRDGVNPEAEITYTGGEKGWKGDVPKFHLDISKKKEYGWEPNYDSRESVKLTIRGILQEGRVKA